MSLTVHLALVFHVLIAVAVMVMVMVMVCGRYQGDHSFKKIIFHDFPGPTEMNFHDLSALHFP